MLCSKPCFSASSPTTLRQALLICSKPYYSAPSPPTVFQVGAQFLPAKIAHAHTLLLPPTGTHTAAGTPSVSSKRVGALRTVQTLRRGLYL